MSIILVDSLYEMNKQTNFDQPEKFNAYSNYVDITKEIFENQSSEKQSKPIIGKIALLPKDEPIIEILNKVAKVFCSDKAKKSGREKPKIRYAVDSNRIAELQAIL